LASAGELPPCVLEVLEYSTDGAADALPGDGAD
jgi:hypothetical protein